MVQCKEIPEIPLDSQQEAKMKKLMAFVILFSSISAYAANLSQAEVKDLISVQDEIYSYCRDKNPDSDPYHYPALCGDEKIKGALDKISKIVKNSGWCYGKKGQASFEMKWHKCTKNSNR